MSDLQLLDVCCLYAAKIGIQAIQADENGTRLKPPYLTVKILTDIILGSTDDIRTAPDGSGFIRVSQRLATVSFTTFGSNAMADAVKVSDKFRDHEVIEYFSESGFSVRGVEGIVDVTALLETKFEKRANFSIHFGYALVQATELGEIRSVQASGDIAEVRGLSHRIQLGVERTH